MKKFVSILVLCTLVCAFVIPVQADVISTDVLKGTPTLDGALDEMYLNSAKLEIAADVAPFYEWSLTAADTKDVSATAYLLWDADYLYICTVVLDSTPTAAEGDPTWQNDASEHWFIDSGLHYKIHVSGSGNFFLGADADAKTPYDFAGAKSASAWTADGYITEIALPFTELAADRTFQYQLQINDIFEPVAVAGLAKNDNSIDSTVMTLVDEWSIEPEVETEADTTDEKVDEDVAPQTFDAGVIAAVAAIVSAAGYALSKKR